MGWNCDDSTHEGYLVGLVFDDGGSFHGHTHPLLEERKEGPTSGRMRELGCPDDLKPSGVLVEVERKNYWLDLPVGDGIPLRHVKVACSCGWRSPLVNAWAGTRWVPTVVLAPEAFEDLAERVWKGHVRSTGVAHDGGCSVAVLAAYADSAAVSGR